jgi:phage regulator Rha-like protein
MFLMDRDGFSLLVMGFTGNKALAWKLKYIEAFNRMEAELMKRQANVLPDFANPVEAARAWADQVEQKMALEAQTKVLAP